MLPPVQVPSHLVVPDGAEILFVVDQHGAEHVCVPSGRRLPRAHLEVRMVVHRSLEGRLLVYVLPGMNVVKTGWSCWGIHRGRIGENCAGSRGALKTRFYASDGVIVPLLHKHGAFMPVKRAGFRLGCALGVTTVATHAK